jgi:lysophospholipase L1-like esterase
VQGCGGDESTTTTVEHDKVIAALGDSITAGSPLWDPDPGVRAQIADPDRRSQFEYWGERADGDFTYRNCGVFGERTDEILARFDECTDAADALIVQGGINDIAQGRSIEAAAGSLQSMVDRGKDLGLVVAIADVLPWNNGPAGADRRIAQLNRAIRDIADREEVLVLPFHDTLEDPDDPGTMAPQWTDDGDHPSIEGYRRLGEGAVQRVR